MEHRLNNRSGERVPPALFVHMDSHHVRHCAGESEGWRFSNPGENTQSRLLGRLGSVLLTLCEHGEQNLLVLLNTERAGQADPRPRQISILNQAVLHSVLGAADGELDVGVELRIVDAKAHDLGREELFAARVRRGQLGVELQGEMSNAGNFDSVSEGIFSCEETNSSWYTKLNMSAFSSLDINLRLDKVGKYSDLPSIGVPTKSFPPPPKRSGEMTTPDMVPASATLDR
ncbi:hypothetical protein EYF80_037130 [Liparis tanakae]|uniref:Uncharacterized protein n=1 Tax=Liparis tanakae TaxID=230148 RepID=A0A4Z2GGY3_9TELE|nr:hypothetical protein EYF80_037130 [Liparis tanakae]